MAPEYQVCFAYAARRGEYDRTVAEINDSIMVCFSQQVSAALADGWELVGGVSLSRDEDGCFALVQAMVKHGEANDEIPY